MYTDYIKKMQKLYQTSLTQVNSLVPNHYGFIAKIVDVDDKEAIGIGEAASIIKASEMALERAFKVYFGEALEEIKEEIKAPKEEPKKEETKKDIKEDIKEEKGKKPEKEAAVEKTTDAPVNKDSERPKKEDAPNNERSSAAKNEEKTDKSKGSASTDVKEENPEDAPEDFVFEYLQVFKGEKASYAIKHLDAPCKNSLGLNTAREVVKGYFEMYHVSNSNKPFAQEIRRFIEYAKYYKEEIL